MNKETPIQTEILTFLNYLPNFHAFRLSNHAVPMLRKGQMTFRKDKWKQLGLADICFFFKGGVGFIEVKDIGKKQSPDQIDFMKLCEKFEIPYFVFDNVNDVEKVFKFNKWIK